MTEELTAKRQKLAPLIGTHNGHFHADEALAVYLLRLLPAYQPSTLVRTRDPEFLSTCHTVVDVGGEYDPSANRYDHHQRTFNTTFPKHATKLSSAGLVYMHFGKPIIAQRAGLTETAPEVDILYNKIYDEFIEAIDANDNGISVYDPVETAHIQKRFNDHGVSLASLISDLNNEFDPSAEPALPKDVSEPPKDPKALEDARFLQASKLIGNTFLRKLHYYTHTWLPTRTTVHAAYHSRLETDPSGAILLFTTPGTPWKDHLYTLEASEPDSPKVLYVIYPENAEPETKWRVQCVPESKDSFVSRKPLKEEWRGMRDEDLSKMAGIEGSVFVHASGFIGGNKTKDGVVEMARRSMA
ncbi:MAG: hypothetical protein MMC33_000916 [Icmadophila ericetorum]|nr:hypothetical protein [Icmadophila ericetorum]